MWFNKDLSPAAKTNFDRGGSFISQVRKSTLSSPVFDKKGFQYLSNMQGSLVACSHSDLRRVFHSQFHAK